ncbi:MAG TPA: SDR family NAD(P)-dependent oxidoreductase [Polyangiaceae bacterium]|nr:SDR family NAD(P)-dependent oxidoreductase [Polyangiaceae bacterium]
MNWEKRVVLVTGAAGFIGSHLVERLARLGCRTRAFVHYNSAGSSGWLDSSPCRNDIEIVQGDIRDGDSVHAAAKGVDAIFHLAALIGIPYSYRTPLAYVRTNVEGTLNVLEAARNNGVARVVQTSTSEVYGTAQFVPITEAHPLKGQSPYSASKIGADKLAESYYLSFGVPVVTLRPFNTYGPRQSARAVIPTVISQALRGADLRLGNLTPTRDFNFVTDTAEAFVKAASVDAAIGKTIQIGTGREISMGDLVQAVSALVGRELAVTTDAERVRPTGSEVDRLLCDPSLAKSVLGWESTVDFNDGLRQTFEWIKENQSRFSPETYSV